jgi:hypothetical protein
MLTIVTNSSAVQAQNQMMSFLATTRPTWPLQLCKMDTALTKSASPYIGQLILTTTETVTAATIWHCYKLEGRELEPQ